MESVFQISSIGKALNKVQNPTFDWGKQKTWTDSDPQVTLRSQYCGSRAERGTLCPSWKRPECFQWEASELWSSTLNYPVTRNWIPHDRHVNRPGHDIHMIVELYTLQQLYHEKKCAKMVKPGVFLGRKICGGQEFRETGSDKENVWTN